eukprot:11184869-Alexandrium_andersonii.AAC.1
MPLGRLARRVLQPASPVREGGIVDAHGGRGPVVPPGRRAALACLRAAWPGVCFSLRRLSRGGGVSGRRSG